MEAEGSLGFEAVKGRWTVGVGGSWRVVGAESAKGSSSVGVGGSQNVAGVWSATTVSKSDDGKSDDGKQKWQWASKSDEYGERFGSNSEWFGEIVENGDRCEWVCQKGSLRMGSVLGCCEWVQCWDRCEWRA